MHHKLDVHPIPEEVFYVNEPGLAIPPFFETKAENGLALTGKTISCGGILPDDNVRVYVPMDLNADNILRQLNRLRASLGLPEESNEVSYSLGVAKIIAQLEIYDQIWVARDLAHAVRKENGGVYHSQRGIALAKKIVATLSQLEGNAECFPFDEIEELNADFWL